MKRLMAIACAVALAALHGCGDEPAPVGAGRADTDVDGVSTTAAAATTSAVPPPPSSTSTPRSPKPTCSAAGLAAIQPAQATLPALVAATRQAIIDASIACDWAALRKLTDVAGEQFVYSFGGGSDPVSHWQSVEATQGGGVLRALVIVLRAPVRSFPGDQGPEFAWPDAFHADPLTDAHRAPLAELYSAADFAAFREFGGYVGWRVGIDADGTWKFFVQGD